MIDLSNAEASLKYDKLCRFIKRSFYLRKANIKAIGKVRNLKKIQWWMKEVYD